ncbi:MAG: hypothetical protein PHY09_05970 [Desulfuromonadaceae bacterium]|nr:hypothetical protein [Desulfuromonadaceae bacterium]MDD5107210.1 hypothetical protein [Desulfuromonadaceae bacterium]
MAKIDITTEGDLLLLTVIGEATAKEMVAVVNEYYYKYSYTNVIWDFRKGAMRPDPSEFKALAEAVKTVLAHGTRSGGKTIFIGSTDNDYKRLCLYSIMAESAEIPIEYFVTRTMEEALALLTAHHTP